MGIHWWEVLGLIGITLVFSSGRVFQPLREWLLGFQRKGNLLRLGGELLSCSMCTGIWVGFLWGVIVEGFSLAHSLTLGGVVSVASLATDETLGIVALFRILKMQKGQGAMTPTEMVQARQKLQAKQETRQADLMREARARRRGTPRDLMEDDADAVADAQEAYADTLLIGEVPRGTG